MDMESALNTSVDGGSPGVGVQDVRLNNSSTNAARIMGFAENSI